MIVYAAGRQSGKTNAVIRWFLEDPRGRGVIVLDKKRRNFFLHTLYRMSGFTRVQFRRYEDNVIVGSQLFGRVGLRYKFRELAIDDAESVIEDLLGTRIDFIAMNATLLDFRYTRAEDQGDYVDGEMIPDYDDESYGYAKAIGPAFRAIEE